MKYKQRPHSDPPLSDTLPTNLATIGYATDEAFLIYAHLSSKLATVILTLSPASQYFQQPLNISILISVASQNLNINFNSLSKSQ